MGILLRASLRLALKSALPVAASLKTYQSPVPWVRKMTGDKERIVRLGAINHLLPRQYGLVGLHVKGKHPVGLGHLRWICHHIADDQGALTRRNDVQAHRPRGVAGRGDSRYFTGQGMFTSQEIENA